MAESPGSAVTLAAGWHKIEVDYYHGSAETGNNGLILSYTPQGGSKQVIPSSVLRTVQATTGYTYDDAGNMTSLTDADGNFSQWHYNDLNQVDEETDPLDHHTDYVYDADGNLVQKTDRDDRITQYDYDHLNRETAERWRNTDDTANIEVFGYSYNDDSWLTGVTDKNADGDLMSADYSYTYDNLGNVTSITSDDVFLTNPVVLTQGFDPNSNRTSLTAQIDGVDDFTNTYGYDALNRMSSIEQETVQSYVGGTSSAHNYKYVAFTYNAGSQFDTISRYQSSGATELVATSSYGYDDAGRLTGLTYAKGSSTFAGYGLTYDAANRLTSFTNSQNASDNAVYHYDNASQLTAVDQDGVSNTETYSYDPNGNRLSSMNSSGSASYTVDTDNRITSDGTYDYQYDAEGNMIKKLLHGTDTVVDEYTYDNRNRLVSESAADVHYTYDAFDRLIGKRTYWTPDHTSSTQEAYVYDGSQIVLRFVGGPSMGTADLSDRQLWGPAVDLLLADEYLPYDPGHPNDVDIRWTIIDQQNTIRGMMSHNSTTHVTTGGEGTGPYDAFGLPDDSYWDGNFDYTGRFEDYDDNLQYNGDRWYNHDLGRWMSQDPLGLGPDSNPYRYVGNSPTNETDPTGLIGSMSHVPSKPNQFGPDPVQLWWYYFTHPINQLDPDLQNVWNLYIVESLAALGLKGVSMCPTAPTNPRYPGLPGEPVGEPVNPPVQPPMPPGRGTGGPIDSPPPEPPMPPGRGTGGPIDSPPPNPPWQWPPPGAGHG